MAGMVLGAGSREPTSSMVNIKQRANWKWRKAMNSQNPSPMTFPTGRSTPSRFQDGPQIATINWEPRVQMFEATGDISHSKHPTYQQGKQKLSHATLCSLTPLRKGNGYVDFIPDVAFGGGYIYLLIYSVSFAHS